MCIKHGRSLPMCAYSPRGSLMELQLFLAVLLDEKKQTIHDWCSHGMGLPNLVIVRSCLTGVSTTRTTSTVRNILATWLSVHVRRGRSFRLVVEWTVSGLPHLHGASKSSILPGERRVVPSIRIDDAVQFRCIWFGSAPLSVEFVRIDCSLVVRGLRRFLAKRNHKNRREIKVDHIILLHAFHLPSCSLWSLLF